MAVGCTKLFAVNVRRTLFSLFELPKEIGIIIKSALKGDRIEGHIAVEQFLGKQDAAK